MAERPVPARPRSGSGGGTAGQISGPSLLNLSAYSSGLCAHLQRRQEAGEDDSAREPHSGRPCESACWSWRPCTAAPRRCCCGLTAVPGPRYAAAAMGHRVAGAFTKPAPAALVSATNRAASKRPGLCTRCAAGWRSVSRPAAAAGMRRAGASAEGLHADWAARPGHKCRPYCSR